MKPKQTLWRKEIIIKADKGFYFDTSIPPLIQSAKNKIKINFWQKKKKVV